MQVARYKLDTEAVKQLFQRFVDAIEASGLELGHYEILKAGFDIIGATLSGIDCPNCRKLARREIKRRIPGLLADAMAFAAKLDAERGNVAPDEHLH
jgi:hypothetical protein